MAAAVSAHVAAVREGLASVRASARDTAVKLAAARGDLDDRIAKAQGRLWKATEGCISREEAERRAAELVAVLANRAGAHLHPLVEPAPDGLVRSLGALERVSAVSWTALRDPEGLLAWIMGRLDREAAARGGWSEMGKDDRDRERRSAEHEFAVLDSAATALEREIRQAGLVADDRSDAQPTGPTVEVGR